MRSPCAKLCLGLSILLVCVGTALGQQKAPELFTPVKQFQSTQDQSQRITQLRQLPTTKSLDLVRINVGALQDSSTQLTIPGGRSLTFTKKSVQTTGGANFIWHGTLSEVPGVATLVVRNGNITGTVQDGQNLYHIEAVGGGMHALIKIDTAKFPPEHPPSFKNKEREAKPKASAAGAPANQHDGPVGIDVLVAYTPAAKSSVSDIDATIQLAVAEANQSYANSGINITLNLVDSFQVNYSEAGKTYDTILADFVGNTDVNSRRDKSGADLSALIINQTDYCGLADAIGATAATAFVAVHYGCATGYYSFAHELGHLMGARHDQLNDPSTSPYAYGHGFQHTTAPVWRTVMAYDCSGGCPRVQYWSNPNVSYGGVPMGTAATNDNARVLNGTATTVAGFRQRIANGHLWHTARYANGGWSGLGDVQGQFSIPGPVTAVGAATGASGETQFVFTTSDGHLWHTLRRTNGSWSGLGDVQGQFAIPGPVKAVAGAAGAGGETQFIFTTSNGHLWHTARYANGSWSGLGDVQGQFAIPGPVTAVGAASGASGETQFVFTTSDGHLWHTLRRANGSWTGLGDVQGQFAIPGPVKAVAGAAGGGGETQFIFTTSDGHLWHTLRRANGSWSGLGDVQGQFAIPGPVTAVSAASGASGETQFAFTTSDGHLWHTLRRANGSWTGLGDVQGQFAIPGAVKAVAGAAAAPGETQFMFVAP